MNPKNNGAGALDMSQCERAYMLLNENLKSRKDVLNRQFYMVPVQEDGEVWFCFLSEPEITNVFGCRIETRWRLKMSWSQVYALLEHPDISDDDCAINLDALNTRLTRARKEIGVPFAMTLPQSKYGNEAAFRLLAKRAVN